MAVGNKTEFPRHKMRHAKVTVCLVFQVNRWAGVNGEMMPLHMMLWKLGGGEPVMLKNNASPTGVDTRKRDGAFGRGGHDFLNVRAYKTNGASNHEAVPRLGMVVYFILQAAF